MEYDHRNNKTWSWFWCRLYRQNYSKTNQMKNQNGLERWLRGSEHWLLFQRSWVQFPATTWWLTAICNEIWCPLLVCLKTVTVYSHKQIRFFFWGEGWFWDRVSLYSPGCPGTHSVNQAGLKLRNPPASASRVLGLKAWATTAWL